MSKADDTKDKEKPRAKVIGQDGDVFNIIGISQRALRKAGKEKEAQELYERVTLKAENYNDALNIMQEYVKFIE